jgi:hypothetical protein
MRPWENTPHSGLRKLGVQILTRVMGSWWPSSVNRYSLNTVVLSICGALVPRPLWIPKSVNTPVPSIK